MKSLGNSVFVTYFSVSIIKCCGFSSLTWFASWVMDAGVHLGSELFPAWTKFMEFWLKLRAFIGKSVGYWEILAIGSRSCNDL